MRAEAEARTATDDGQRGILLFRSCWLLLLFLAYAAFFPVSSGSVEGVVREESGRLSGPNPGGSSGTGRTRGSQQSRRRGDCTLESLEQCLATLQGVTQSDRLAFPANREDLDAVCRQLREGVTCVDNHMDLCFNKQQRQIVESVVAGSRQAIVDLCLDRRMQAEYLEHASCFREVATSPHKCGPYYQRVVQAGSSTGNESANQPLDVQAGLRQYCCAFTEFLRCKIRLVELECSSEASRFLQLNTEKMSGALIHQHCSLYTYDSTCQTDPAGTGPSTALHPILWLLLGVVMVLIG